MLNVNSHWFNQWRIRMVFFLYFAKLRVSFSSHRHWTLRAVLINLVKPPYIYPTFYVRFSCGGLAAWRLAGTKHKICTGLGWVIFQINHFVCIASYTYLCVVKWCVFARAARHSNHTDAYTHIHSKRYYYLFYVSRACFWCCGGGITQEFPKEYLHRNTYILYCLLYDWISILLCDYGVCGSFICSEYIWRIVYGHI